MPDAADRIKGISTAGVSNRWLDTVTYVNALKRELEREEESCPGFAPDPSRPGRATTET